MDKLDDFQRATPSYVHSQMSIHFPGDGSQTLLFVQVFPSPPT